MKKTKSGARAGSQKNTAAACVPIEKKVGFELQSAPCLDVENDGPEAAGEAVPAAWMTPQLIERTRAGWSRHYGRPLERGEALEILRNIDWFGNFLRRWRKGLVT